MKVKELLEYYSSSDKFHETEWVSNLKKKYYWVKGKDKNGKDKRWGPFESSLEANQFKLSRKDIRSPSVAFEFTKQE